MLNVLHARATTYILRWLKQCLLTILANNMQHKYLACRCVCWRSVPKLAVMLPVHGCCGWLAGWLAVTCCCCRCRNSVIDRTALQLSSYRPPACCGLPQPLGPGTATHNVQLTSYSALIMTTMNNTAPCLLFSWSASRLNLYGVYPGNEGPSKP